MIKAVQYIHASANETEAREALDFLRAQVDFIGGRVLEPSASKPGWRVQVLFEDCGHDAPLPDGCLRVTAPRSFLRQLGA
jgi:hypothetical protein